MSVAYTVRYVQSSLAHRALGILGRTNVPWWVVSASSLVRGIVRRASAVDDVNDDPQQHSTSCLCIAVSRRLVRQHASSTGAYRRDFAVQVDTGWRQLISKPSSHWRSQRVPGCPWTPPSDPRIKFLIKDGLWYVDWTIGAWKSQSE